jgi:hypothetical protein
VFICILPRRLGPTMGVPKQRWTAEEEAALRAGVARHGVGNWRTILKDPEFSSTLCYRSNVDLKVTIVHLILLTLACFSEGNFKFWYALISSLILLPIPSFSTYHNAGQMAQHECNFHRI